MMKRLRTLIRVLLILVLVLAMAATVAVGWIGSSHMITPPRRVLQDYHLEILADPERRGLSVEPWTGPQATPCLIVTPSQIPAVTPKGQQLRSMVDEVPAWGDIRGTVVLLHGHCGRKEDHLPICERFCAAGFRCILVDLPGHGDNPAQLARFGWKEADLIGSLTDACAAEFGFVGSPAFLFGVSQGGAIALQVAAKNPAHWAGVISVAAFASLDEPMRSALSQADPKLQPLGPVALTAVSWTTRARAGFFPDQIRPVDAARKLTLPALVFHGGADRFVSPDRAQRIFDAIPSPDKRLRIIEGAGHGRVLSADAANTYADCCRFMLAACAEIDAKRFR
ncbi:hypothetical protein HAHE_32970 [Haloferula helveola]|uniref:Serine aminopeptidase S33 domain-containing protein n=1 Tax=Haloferula helveola TaxID=490095 RepID=A0ABM7RI61_9BACT|nr:hypothetical protein HAHE_32970 [Haloferula helveola]